jgi:hypothetical protein
MASYIFYALLLVINAALGHFIFQWAWKKIKPLREVNEERDSKYPPFRRVDVGKWKKWKFYLGAVTLLPLRFAIGLFIIVTLYIMFK